MIKRTWKATGEEKAQWKRQRPFCASSELNSYELRRQGCELRRGRSHPLLLSPAQQWFSEAKTALLHPLDPASSEQGAEPRLQARSSTALPVCRGSVDLPRERRSSSCSVNAWHRKKIIFLFNYCITEGGGPGEGCHCTGSHLAGKTSLLGRSFLEKLKPRYYPA